MVPGTPPHGSGPVGELVGWWQRSHLAFVAAVLGGFVLLAFGFRWATKSPGEPAPSPTPGSVQLQAQGTRVVIRHQGQQQVELRARRAQVSPDFRRAQLEGVRGATLFREGRPYLRVRADRLVFDRTTQNFEATGRVEVTSPEGDWLRSSYMVYRNDRAMLAFPRGVEFQLGGHRARARTLRLFVLDQTVEMEGDVDVVLDLRAVSTPVPNRP